MRSNICLFDGDGDLYVTEFGHSVLDRAKTVSPRIRNGYLLHFVVSGVCHFSEFDVPEGKALLIAKDKKHHFSVDVGYEHYWLAFDGTGAQSLLSECGISGKEHTLFDIGSFEFLKKMLSAAYEDCQEHKNMKVAIGALTASLRLIENKGTQYSESDIAKAVRFIENNYHQKITMEEVASFVALCEKHFCKKFSRVMGMPPQRYLLKTKMETARKMVQNTDLKIKEIAASIGYDSQLTFSAAYKKYFGHSPTDDRRIKKVILSEPQYLV